MHGGGKQFQHEVRLHHLFNQEVLLTPTIRPVSCCVPSLLSYRAQSSLRYLEKIWKSKLSVLIYIEHAELLFVLCLSETLVSQYLSNKMHMELVLSRPPFSSNYFIGPRGREWLTQSRVEGKQKSYAQELRLFLPLHSLQLHGHL